MPFFSATTSTVMEVIVLPSPIDETEELPEFEDPSVEINLPLISMSKKTQTPRKFGHDDEDEWDFLVFTKMTPLPTSEIMPGTPVPDLDDITDIWESVMGEYGLDGNTLVGEHGSVPDDIPVYPDGMVSPPSSPEVYVNPVRAGRRQVKRMPGMKEQVTRDTPIKPSGKKMIKMRTSPPQQRVKHWSTGWKNMIKMADSK